MFRINYYNKIQKIYYLSTILKQYIFATWHIFSQRIPSWAGFSFLPLHALSHFLFIQKP
ncbi:hypothetical protein HanRHA438_Chr05g0208401 [Helianthus annuus]|uniref:Uncharacterized protein n=1 Tax=Helianthus annuus TaxID=4232 RepID=A0A251ULT7_HELAN|nr:hypothetical protein HanXRQr2_Chr05g0198771 [Helianthus annuus]KAJ0569186.1 hypothetical protein HanHA300_Chr05g0163191 [Helianthus annuus]KAJ0583482.1 hypothetical protein HanHA89_Chr05g0177081 [Helianthus annuus]KAJ0746216.1 hypothetical protein HanOQP8_Chr05g0174991 [Helianthus annuus]KAJ0749224.1 hypothetical protein HanLR1_Chr05g0167331 [Helianthus annuus]